MLVCVAGRGDRDIAMVSDLRNGLFGVDLWRRPGGDGWEVNADGACERPLSGWCNVVSPKPCLRLITNESLFVFARFVRLPTDLSSPV